MVNRRRGRVGRPDQAESANRHVMRRSFRLAANEVVPSRADLLVAASSI